ncbi:unnamed protein product [Phytomonas sp. EM1]|nr:unnamed protein product [Phytomonas sp. EM1]|eukprot:CCW65395.1 unnamed protein product [Phytomonas sp. isolate EM1]
MAPNETRPVHSSGPLICAFSDPLVSDKIVAGQSCCKSQTAVVGSAAPYRAEERIPSSQVAASARKPPPTLPLAPARPRHSRRGMSAH